jgi:hypothetical protein
MFSHPHRLAWSCPLLAALAVAAAAPAPARAEGTLRAELEALAKDVKKLLDGRGDTAIAVGQFVGPTDLPSSAGPAIALLLTEELKKQGLDVRRRAELTIEGRYVDTIDAQSDRLAVALSIKIVDRQGEEIVGLKLKPRGIFGDPTIASLLGLTVQLPPGGDGKERDQRLKDSIKKPRTQLDKTRISAAGAPYAIEVLVKSGGKYLPRAAKEEDGLAFVPIKRDEVYAIRLVNDSPHEAAVTVTVDGLNVFTFSEIRDKKTGRPCFSRLILKPKSSYLLKGWHKTNERSNEFLVTAYDKSAAAELGSTANIGTITVSFAAAWPKNGKPPADEPRNPDKHARSADATARGLEFHEKFTEVQRDFGVTRAAVSVRYAK